MALAWWIPGIALAIGYFTYLFSMMRRKVGANAASSSPEAYHAEF